jgi:predicted transcriptional regulator
MQTQSSNSAKALRKNFTMSDETAKELDFLAVLLRKNRSQIIQELIRKEAEAKRNELRLAKLQAMKGLLTGLLHEQSIQSMKTEREL